MVSLCSIFIWERYEKKGSFIDDSTKKSVDFDNLELYVAVKGGSDVYGCEAFRYKVKGKDAQKALGMSIDDFLLLSSDLVGHPIDFDFVINYYGEISITDLTFID